MILAGKYELLELIGGAAIPVHKGKRAASGEGVFVHRLSSGSPAAMQALTMALRYAIQHPGRGALLDVVDEAGATYIITESKPEYISLLDWLPWALDGRSAGAVRPVVAATPQRSGPPPEGDFTRMFARKQTPDSGPLPPERAPAASPKASERPEGEFTRLFRGGHPASGHEASAKKEEAFEKAAAPESPASPGEFTRLFRNPVAQPGQTPDFPSTPAAPKREQGDFTRTFGPPEQRARMEPPLPPVDPPSGVLSDHSRTPPQAAPDVPRPASEFTRVIRRGAPELPTSNAPSSTDPPAAKADASIPIAAPKPALPQIPPVAMPPIPPPPLQAPPIPPAVKLPPPSRGVLPVVIVVIAVLVLALALIAFFAIRK